jgi:hypothetical protein
MIIIKKEAPTENGFGPFGTLPTKPVPDVVFPIGEGLAFNLARPRPLSLKIGISYQPRAWRPPTANMVSVFREDENAN